MTDTRQTTHLKLSPDGLDEDILTEAYTPEDIDEGLRKLGCDPEAIGQRGAALVAGLLKKRRLSWMDEVRAERQRMSEVEEA